MNTNELMAKLQAKYPYEKEYLYPINIEIFAAIIPGND